MSHSIVEQYDGDLDLTPLDFVIQLVAKHRDTDPIDLTELHQYIDRDLVDRFLRRPPAAGELRFRWDIVTVTLSADRTVEVTTGERRENTPSHNNHKKSGAETPATT